MPGGRQIEDVSFRICRPAVMRTSKPDRRVAIDYTGAAGTLVGTHLGILEAAAPSSLRHRRSASLRGGAA